jgi:hypothetical protein
MYIKCDTVTHSPNHCCRGKATAHSISIVEPCVTVSNTQQFSLAMETQQLFASALSNYKIFLTALNNIKVIGSSCKAPCICKIIYKFELVLHVKHLVFVRLYTNLNWFFM